MATGQKIFSDSSSRSVYTKHMMLENLVSFLKAKKRNKYPSQLSCKVPYSNDGYSVCVRTVSLIDSKLAFQNLVVFDRGLVPLFLSSARACEGGSGVI